MNNPYRDRRWRKLRKAFLAEHPLCALCQQSGYDTAASIVDHIVPHNGDHDLFWDRDNLQGLCPSCHSGVKRIKDKHGTHQACGVDGYPLDYGHWWSNKI